MRYSFFILSDGVNTPQDCLDAFRGTTANLKGSPVKVGALVPLFENVAIVDARNGVATSDVTIAFDCPFTIQGVEAVAGYTITQTNLEANGNEIYSKFTGATVVTSFAKGSLYLIPRKNIPNVKASMTASDYVTIDSDGTPLVFSATHVAYFALNDTALIGVVSISNTNSVEFNKQAFAQEQVDMLEGQKKRGSQFANVFLQA